MTEFNTSGNIGGIQGHSQGDLFPWHIVVVRRAATKTGYLYAQNARTGQVTAKYRFDDNNGPTQLQADRSLTETLRNEGV